MWNQFSEIACYLYVDNVQQSRKLAGNIDQTRLGNTKREKNNIIIAIHYAQNPFNHCRFAFEDLLVITREKLVNIG